MTENQIREIVFGVLRRARAGAAPSSVDVFSDTDHDGTPIIKITAHYDGRPDSHPGASVDAAHEIRNELLQQGEDRFVFLSSDFSEEPKFDEEDVE